MTKEIDNLGIAILKGVCNVEAKDLVVDLSEFELGTLLDVDTLKELPVIKSVIASYKTWHSIRDQLFLRKVANFFSGCPKFTADEKEEFIKIHLNELEQSKRLGEALVLILDRLDDMKKPVILAKIFAAFIRGKIDFDVFRRLATAIDHGSTEDLMELANPKPSPPDLYHRGDLQRKKLYSNLAGTGLVGLPNFTGISPITGVSFVVNDLGKIFITCMEETA